MKRDIYLSIAGGEALLFLENSTKATSIESLEQFLIFTGFNIYLILNLLVSEKLITVVRNEQGRTISVVLA